MAQSNDFYKRDPDDRVYWKNSPNIGEFLFSFDKKRVFNLFRDYPEKLTPEEKKIFDEENPEWADFFRDRS